MAIVSGQSSKSITRTHHQRVPVLAVVSHARPVAARLLLLRNLAAVDFVPILAVSVMTAPSVLLQSNLAVVTPAIALRRATTPRARIWVGRGRNGTA